LISIDNRAKEREPGGQTPWPNLKLNHTKRPANYLMKLAETGQVAELVESSLQLIELWFEIIEKWLQLIKKSAGLIKKPGQLIQLRPYGNFFS
jgi:hypothetical protein